VRQSGGERQRFALARALPKDAPVLLLDEPTSAVDRKTERAIVAAIRRLAKGRTCFIIAHRPNALAICDLRLRIENGRVVETRGRKRNPRRKRAAAAAHRAHLQRTKTREREAPAPRTRTRVREAPSRLGSAPEPATTSRQAT